MPTRPVRTRPRAARRRRLAVAGLLSVLLAGCVPVPGAGGEAHGPGALDDAPAEAGSLEAGAIEAGRANGPTTPPEVFACVGPLEDPARPITDAGVAAPLDIQGTALGTSGVTLLHVTPGDGRTLTHSGGSLADAACAGRVVEGPEDDPHLRTLAAAWAALDGAPLILTAGGRTDPSSDAGAPTGTAPDARRALDATLALAEVTAARSEGGGIVLMLADDVASQADVVAHVRSGSVPLVLPMDAVAATALLAELAERGLAADVRWAASSLDHTHALQAILAEALVDDGSRDADGEERPTRWQAPDAPRADPRAAPHADGELWLGDVRDPAAALQAAVAAATRGATFVAVDGGELRSGAARTERMRAFMGLGPGTGLGPGLSPTRPEAAAPERGRTIVLVGELEEHTRWQLTTVLTGTPLPTGGFLPLEEQRIVALYGSPGAPAMGLLAQRDDAATIALAREYAAGYEGAVDGRTVVPGLDIIATIASSSPEPTGDYSRRVPLARLRPLVDLAREEGVAVLLDLQPGRTDFLTQAQELEELLHEPHVHLALDPEWRIGPREQHLVRIGSVSADEVQAVADWLADLVRRERLPQKVLMLHQFTLGMLPDRDTVVIPPELVGVVHMDGQGSLAAKERTYAAIVAGAEAQWAWGWKNFTRIDRPLATPERTLARTPVPVIVTYQ